MCHAHAQNDNGCILAAALAALRHADKIYLMRIMAILGYHHNCNRSTQCSRSIAQNSCKDVSDTSTSATTSADTSRHAFTICNYAACNLNGHRRCPRLSVRDIILSIAAYTDLQPLKVPCNARPMQFNFLSCISYLPHVTVSLYWSSLTIP